MNRILLSGPDTDPSDREALLRAFDSGWIAPLGPEVDAFEAELAEVTGRGFAVALASGTAALHLALVELGVGPGDVVVSASFTFAATVNPIRYCGASPWLIDAERETWGLCPDLLADALRTAERSGRLPKAVIGVDLFGQCFDHLAVAEVCDRYGVPLLLDGAESLGASNSAGLPAASTGALAVLSFNGNKMITTSGGGALLTDDGATAERARYLATQARLPAPHYEHEDVGFNYRLSNLLAALGRSQLDRLDSKVAARQAIRDRYRQAFATLEGISVAQDTAASRSNAWLTVATLEPETLGIDATGMREALAARGIEARPVWKPMHRQPLYSDAPAFLNGVSDQAFATGLCLPSGSGLSTADVETVIATIHEVLQR